MNPKVINSLNARLARIEALLENSDVFKAAGGTTYGGLQYQGSQYNYNFEALDGGSSMLDQQLMQNYGFGPSDMALFELQQRIAELELLVAGGSNDTNQSGALDATQSVGDDGSNGTGEVNPGAEVAGTAFLGSAIGYTPIVAAVDTPFTLTAAVDSDGAWSGTGYSVPSDGYYLCVGDASGAESNLFPSSFSFYLAQTGSATVTYQSTAAQPASPLVTITHNVTVSAVFSCARGDILRFRYLAPAAGTSSIDFVRLSVVRIGGR